MFHSARRTLTLWYLLISMMVSVAFSLGIFAVVSHEVDRFEQAQRFRMERRFFNEQSKTPDERYRRFQSTLNNPEIIAETKQRILMVLILINGGVAILSGGLGYVLAGRALTPIKEMIDDQNRFITDASHELRTPLTSLKSTFEVFLRDKKTDLFKAQALIKESINEVDRLHMLSDALLQLSSYEKPDGQFRFEDTALEAIIKEAVFSVTSLARKKKISFVVSPTNSLVKGDRDRLIELFVILFDNAIKYSSPGGRIIVKIKKTEKYVEISVADFGIGIPASDIPHIFERFYRADNARLRNAIGGYGLGLAIAQKIVEIHQGTISVISNPKKGSTFTVELPVS